VSAARPLRIASPISVAEEIDGLATAGANELYCGVLPRAWVDRHGPTVWLNRRGPDKANLRSFGELERLVARAHQRGLAVRVTLNSPYYDERQLADAVVVAKAIQATGADGVIVGDPALVLALRDDDVPLDVTLSSMAAVHNVEACRFFVDLGVRRIVLPRYVTLDEIRTLRQGLPDVELEVFILNDGCVYEEAHCATTHTEGAFCMTDWRYDFARLDGEALGADEAHGLARNVEAHKRWIWYVTNSGGTYTERGIPNGPCGLCAIAELADLGVDCLKIVGREAHPFRKRRSVEMVRAIVDRVNDGGSADEARAASREIRETPEHCDAGFMCYFRTAPEARNP
jgi:putative protease